MNLTNIKEQFTNKWVQGGAVVLMILFIFMSLLAGLMKKEDLNSYIQEIEPAFLIPTPTVSVELQIAIDEAKHTAQEYNDWQSNLKIDYPWLRKLPLAGEKYFVYFKLDKKVFIGRLYPKAGDNVEEMKADIKRQLKEVKGISTENYTFQWTISPQ